MEQQIKEYESLTELLNDLEIQEIPVVQRKRLIERFLLDRAVVKRVPYTGSFELTPLCNLDCKMCYVHLKEKQMKQKPLSTEQWLNIARQAIESGMVNAEITGGECLTHPGFKEIYTYLQSFGIKVSVLTNGVLLNEEMLGFFLKHPPRMIQITLYGSSDDAYERVTGHRVYRQVVDAINRVREAGIRIRVSVTPNKYSEDDIMQILQLLRSMNIDYAVSGVTLNAREETQREPNDYEISESALVEIIKDENEYKKQLEKAYPMPPGKEFLGKVKGFSTEGVPCTAGKCVFHINWKGELTPCIPFNSVAYSVLELGFNEAWQKVNSKMWAYSEPEECVSCNLRKSCQLCPADRTGGIYGGSANKAACRRIKTYINNGIIELKQ